MSNISSGFQKNKFLNRFYLVLKVNSQLVLNDYSLLFPVMIGLISIFGLSIFLLLAGFPRQSVQAVPTQTATPFKYLLLATEVVLPTQEDQFVISSDIQPTPPMDLDKNVMPTPTFDGPNGKSAGTLPLAHSEEAEINAPNIFAPTFTSTPDPIFAEAEPMTLGKYDASDPHIVHNGSWVNQGDLLISNTVGNHVAFKFIGQQIVLGYQSDANVGELTINIDGAETTITQLVGNAWFSQKLDGGTHFVILTHTSGESINLDYVDISG